MNRERLVFSFAKPILAAVVTIVIFAPGIQTASAQAITATTPFAFSVNGQFYPPGRYQFTMLHPWLLSIRNLNGGGKKFFMVTPEENRPPGLNGGLLFRNSGEHKDLQEVDMAGADSSAEVLQDKTRSTGGRLNLTIVGADRAW